MNPSPTFRNSAIWKHYPGSTLTLVQAEKPTSMFVIVAFIVIAAVAPALFIRGHVPKLAVGAVFAGVLVAARRLDKRQEEASERVAHIDKRLAAFAKALGLTVEELSDRDLYDIVLKSLKTMQRYMKAGDEENYRGLLSLYAEFGLLEQEERLREEDKSWRPMHRQLGLST